MVKTTISLQSATVWTSVCHNRVFLCLSEMSSRDVVEFHGDFAVGK